MNKSADTLVWSMTCVSRTLIDVDVWRETRLQATLPREQGCLRWFGGGSCLENARKNEDLEGTKMLGMVIVRLGGRWRTGADYADEHLEQTLRNR